MNQSTPKWMVTDFDFVGLKRSNKVSHVGNTNPLVLANILFHMGYHEKKNTNDFSSIGNKQWLF